MVLTTHNVLYILFELSFWYTVSFLSLSLCLTIVACLKGYEGVKNTMNCWPAALSSSGAIILSAYCMSENTDRKREREHILLKHTGTEHKYKIFVKFINFTLF